MSVALFSTVAQAARIKDVAQVAGVRSNQLVGYGLVSGLPGTGEANPFTEQSFAAMLQNFGIQMRRAQSQKLKTLPQSWLRQSCRLSLNRVSKWT